MTVRVGLEHILGKIDFNIIDKGGYKNIGSSKSFDYIKQIYELAREQDQEDKNNESTSVEIEGTLSVFTPILPGPAHIKKNLHLDFRRNVDRFQNLIEKEGALQKTTIDSLISCSAGQMIRRKDQTETEEVRLGLFQSIVRNGIPVIINRDYYRNVVKDVFEKSANPWFVEAKVKGRMVHIKNDMIDELSKIGSIEKILNWEDYEVLRKSTALRVDKAELGISYVGNPRYLDGDIWIAVRKNGDEQIVSRFLELSDKEEFIEDRINLKEDCEMNYPNATVIDQYDNMDKLL